MSIKKSKKVETLGVKLEIEVETNKHKTVINDPENYASSLKKLCSPIT
jgi:hypothetical protein